MWVWAHPKVSRFPLVTMHTSSSGQESSAPTREKGISLRHEIEHWANHDTSTLIHGRARGVGMTKRVLTAVAQVLPDEGPDHLTRLDIRRGWGDVLNVR